MTLEIETDSGTGVPVRALPFMIPELTPRMVAESLAWTDLRLHRELYRLQVRPDERLDQADDYFAGCVKLEIGELPADCNDPPHPLIGVRAYRFASPEDGPLSAMDWDEYVRAIRQHEARHIDTDDHHRGTLALLPAGTYVLYRDLQFHYEQVHGIERLDPEWPVHRLSRNRQLPRDIEELVLEGFTNPHSKAVTATQSASKPGPKPKNTEAVEYAERLIAEGMQQTRAVMEAVERFGANKNSIDRTIRKRRQHQ